MRSERIFSRASKETSMYEGGLGGVSPNSERIEHEYPVEGNRLSPPVHEEPLWPPQQEYASWGSRLAAYGIDVLVTLPGLIPLATGYVIAVGDLAETGVVSGDALFLQWFGAFVNLVLWAWNVVVRQARTGQTLGKQDLRIRLTTVDGQPVGIGHTLARAALRVVDALPLYLGLLWPLWDRRRQTFSDKIVGTVVVRTPPGEGDARAPRRRLRGGVIWVATLLVCGFAVPSVVTNLGGSGPSASGAVRGGPIMFQPITDLAPAPCPATPAVVPDLAGVECFTLAPGLTVHEVVNISVVANPDRDAPKTIDIELTERDAAAFADLTRRLAEATQRRHSVEGRLAVVHAGRVWASPTVYEAIPGGRVWITLPERDADQVIAEVIEGS
jgi:uncharacterized RDD family membrane protein YckC